MARTIMDIGVFFQNLTNYAKTWGGYFIMFLGVVLIIWATVLVVKGFISHGSGRPTNWLMIGAMFLVGGLLAFSGYTGVEAFAKMGKDTLETLGKS